MHQPRMTDAPPASASSLPPSLGSAPCPLPGLSICCSSSSSAVLWGQGHDERCFEHPRYAYPGLATIPMAIVLKRRFLVLNREQSGHQSQMPSSLFVGILIFKPSHSTEHSVSAVVQIEKLTQEYKAHSRLLFSIHLQAILSLYFFILETHSAILISGYRLTRVHVP